MRNLGLVILLLITSFSEVGAYTITYDHKDRKFTCENGTDCTTSVPVGKVVTVLIKDSVPDLLTAQVEITEIPPNRDTTAAIRAFLNPGGAAKGGAPPPPSKAGLPAPKTTKAAWQGLPSDVDSVRQAVPASLSDYPAAIRAVKEDVGSLIKNLKIVDDSQFLDRLKAEATAGGFEIGMTDDQVKAFWLAVRQLAAASSSWSDFGPVSYRPASDFTVTITFSGKNDLVPVSDTQTLSLVASTSVAITTGTGLGFSGLVDDHYTSITVTDQPASGTTPAVTHRQGVREQRDIGTAEVVFLIHITGASDSGYFSEIWAPRGISVGGGVSTGVSGRLYSGLTWNIGRLGFATVGVAGGKVKRLSASANLKNLGDVDPEATRRDVFTGSYFAGITLRLPPSP